MLFYLKIQCVAETRLPVVKSSVTIVCFLYFEAVRKEKKKMSCEVVSSYIFCSLQTRFHPDYSALLFQFSALRDQINWVNNLLSLSGGLQFFFLHLTDSFLGVGHKQKDLREGRNKIYYLNS